ncbi:ethylbenzene dehydrogenase-related protein [Nitratiruptor tergarcus]|uniref:Complex iron-sulfur molybdoenzyme family reductase subunit gamma n=1 Tax=Nitratiruptor tergarcus DSM 16512 TaxID=1069081 RepID=A0A1W1WQZ6_9BACT|nr:ethylbenzene dehydrogenase-related protein [Nitratiruptor tergarcus]SMC08629.1 complex iron-sulfur molybdoenzyme family reductase subunit gamma [Nitratiruptor tergarcus DSM 16512]
MRRVITFTAALSLAAVTAMAGNVVTAVKVKSLKNLQCGAKLVRKHAKFVPVTLYPQTTVKLNDKKALELNKDAKAKVAEVAAFTDGKNVAIIMRWPDKSKDVYKGYESDSYPDGFAVQFAADASNPQKLPYIGMGSDGRPVEIFIRKAYGQGVYEPNGNGDVAHQVNEHNTNYFGKGLKKFKKEVKKLGVLPYQRAFVSEGFRSMTEIKDGSVNYRTDMHYVNKKGGMWGGMVVKPLKDAYAAPSKNELAVAVAAWDGKELQRDGLKRLSSWIAVKLPGAKNKALEAVVTEKAKGDVANGKKEFETNCASCHRDRNFQNAPLYMAPGLENIGGQTTAAYIRESILDPNAVVVPGYNRNAHPNFAWYTVDDKGNRTSTMPPFNYLDKKVVEDIVAYLQTQKAEVAK